MSDKPASQMTYDEIKRDFIELMQNMGVSAEKSGSDDPVVINEYREALLRIERNRPTRETLHNLGIYLEDER